MAPYRVHRSPPRDPNRSQFNLVLIFTHYPLISVLTSYHIIIMYPMWLLRSLHVLIIPQ
jgi:hypothetical protein